MVGVGGDLAVSDFWELAQKISASFELPRWMSEIHDIKKLLFDTSSPQVHLLEGILTASKPNVPLLGYQGGTVAEDCSICASSTVLGREAQPAEARPTMPFGECVPELRRTMEPYVTISDDAILDGATLQEGSLEDQSRVTTHRNTQPTSTNVSTEEEPTEKPAPTEVTTREVTPTEEPLEGPTILAATVSEPTEEPITPQVQHEEQAKVEAPHSDFPGWTKVLHPPQLVTAARQTPLTLSESKQRHHSQSAGGRRAWH